MPTFRPFATKPPPRREVHLHPPAARMTHRFKGILMYPIGGACGWTCRGYWGTRRSTPRRFIPTSGGPCMKEGAHDHTGRPRFDQRAFSIATAPQPMRGPTARGQGPAATSCRPPLHRGAGLLHFLRSRQRENHVDPLVQLGVVVRQVRGLAAREPDQRRAFPLACARPQHPGVREFRNHLHVRGTICPNGVSTGAELKSPTTTVRATGEMACSVCKTVSSSYIWALW